jgi:cytochrome b involved in lipid metabolism
MKQTKLNILVSLLCLTVVVIFSYLLLTQILGRQTTQSTINQNQPSGSKLNLISKAELAIHNKATDCYIVIQNKVYDLTKYLPNHPGGSKQLEKECGKDIDMLGAMHPGGNFSSDKIQKMVESYLVGELGN